MNIKNKLYQLNLELEQFNCQLIAVSKTKPKKNSNWRFNIGTFMSEPRFVERVAVSVYSNLSEPGSSGEALA